MRTSIWVSHMDIARPSSYARQKRIRRMAYGAIALFAVLLITLGLSRLKPAAPGVERATLWIDTVKRGPLLREERGVGTLVPEDIRWIPATTQGRVERILLHPGTAVTADSVILELVNPQLDQELQDAELKVQAAVAGLQNLRVQAQNDFLQQKAVAAGIAADHNKAQMQAEMNEALAKDQLVSDLVDRLTSGFSETRSGLEEQWNKGEDASTEDLRVALMRYRAFFNRLLKV